MGEESQEGGVMCALGSTYTYAEGSAWMSEIGIRVASVVFDRWLFWAPGEIRSKVFSFVGMGLDLESDRKGGLFLGL